MPSARAAAMAGAMISSSSRPNRPPSPACGFRPGDRDARRAAQRCAPARACVMRSVCSTLLAGDGLDRVAQRHVDADQHGAQFVVGQHHAHRHVAPAATPACARGLGLQQLGVARERHAGGGQRLLVQRRGDERGDLAAQRGARGPDHRIRRDAAGRGAHPAPATQAVAGGARPAAAGCSAAAPAPASAGDSITRDRQRRLARPRPATARPRRMVRQVAGHEAARRVARARRGTPWR